MCFMLPAKDTVLSGEQQIDAFTGIFPEAQLEYTAGLAKKRDQGATQRHQHQDGDKRQSESANAHQVVA